VHQFGELAKKTTTLVVPANTADLASMISLATTVVSNARPQVPDAPPARR
jgi:hypothetical protein